MYIQRTNHYSFNEEERKALHTMESILDTLSDGITYGRDDHYRADNFHVNKEDIESMSRLVEALIGADFLTIEDNTMVAG